MIAVRLNEAWMMSPRVERVGETRGGGNGREAERRVVGRGTD